MNPPSVYELTNPSSHSTSRITNIVQSIGLFLSVKHTYLRASYFRCAYAEWNFLKFLQSCAQIPVVRLEQAAGGFVITSGYLSHDSHGTVAQFRTSGVQIDHEIAANFAEPDHRAGADKVKRDLCRGPGFQSRRPSHNFRSGWKRDYQIELFSRGRQPGPVATTDSGYSGITGHQNRFCA